MKAVWEEGCRLLEKPKPWAQCVDPAQATLLALARIGVSMTSAFTLCWLLLRASARGGSRSL
eukprot:1201341-Pyramimonas_sp.AAC.1